MNFPDVAYAPLETMDDVHARKCAGHNVSGQSAEGSSTPGGLGPRKTMEHPASFREILIRNIGNLKCIVLTVTYEYIRPRSTWRPYDKLDTSRNVTPLVYV